MKKFKIFSSKNLKNFSVKNFTEISVKFHWVHFALSSEAVLQTASLLSAKCAKNGAFWRIVDWYAVYLSGPSDLMMQSQKGSRQLAIVEPSADFVQRK